MRLGPMLRAVAVCVLAFASLPLHAQVFRAYVSATGVDTNPCTLAQPCRLLPAALTAVASGGEIWMLDSANYNIGQVNVTKSVTILAIPGVVGSVVATGGGHAININTAGVKVALRNLVIVHLTSSQNGVNFLSGTELHVAGCEISGVSVGINASAPNSKVTVENTALRDLNTGFFADDSVVASLDGVRATGASAGVMVSDGARVAVTNSVISGNTYGVYVYTGTGTGIARAVVADSSLTGNFVGGLAQAAVDGAIAHLSVSRSDVSNNATAGFQASQATTGTTVVVADANTVSHNNIGFMFGGGPPLILSRGNNTLTFNSTDVSGGSLSPLAAQ
jgi:hypothetical protein